MITLRWLRSDGGGLHALSLKDVLRLWALFVLAEQRF